MGNGRQVMRPPPQSELRNRNTLCVQDGSAGERQWQTGQAASSATWAAEAEHLECGNNWIAGEWQWRTCHAASSALWKWNALYLLITELQANGNGRRVMRPPPQTELPKRNAIHVFIMANGNGRKVMWPPPQSELQKRNAICDHYGKWKWQTGHAASAKWVAEAECHICELQVNGNTRQVTRPPPQSELRKRNAICVFRTEVPANGNGRNQGCNGRRIGRVPLRLSFWRLCIKYSVRVLDLKNIFS